MPRPGSCVEAACWACSSCRKPSACCRKPQRAMPPMLTHGVIWVSPSQGLKNSLALQPSLLLCMDAPPVNVIHSQRKGMTMQTPSGSCGKHDCT